MKFLRLIFLSIFVMSVVQNVYAATSKGDGSCPVGQVASGAGCSSIGQNNCSGATRYMCSEKNDCCTTCDGAVSQCTRTCGENVDYVCQEECPDGFYGAKSGSRFYCVKCPIGYKCNDGKREACTGNEYQDEEGQSTCKTCHGENGEAANNYIRDDGTCGTCVAGNYIDDYMCKTCPIGYTCDGTANQTKCLAADGEYTDTTGTTGQSGCSTCGGEGDDKSVIEGEDGEGIGCFCGAGHCMTDNNNGNKCKLCSPGFSCPADSDGAAQNCLKVKKKDEQGNETSEDIYPVDTNGDDLYGVAVCGAGSFTSNEGGASACEYCSTGYTTGCTDNSCTCYDKENGLGCVDGTGNGNVCHKKVGKMCVGSNCDFSWPDGLIIGHIDLSRLKKRKSTAVSFPVFFGSFLANPISIGGGG